MNLTKKKTDILLPTLMYFSNMHVFLSGDEMPKLLPKFASLFDCACANAKMTHGVHIVIGRIA